MTLSFPFSRLHITGGVATTPGLGSAGDWTPGLVNVRQVLYQLPACQFKGTIRQAVKED